MEKAKHALVSGLAANAHQNAHAAHAGDATKSNPGGQQAERVGQGGKKTGGKEPLPTGKDDKKDGKDGAKDGKKRAPTRQDVLSYIKTKPNCKVEKINFLH